MTLVHKTVSASGVPLCNTPNVCCTVVSPPQVQSPSVTVRSPVTLPGHHRPHNAVVCKEEFLCLFFLIPSSFPPGPAALPRPPPTYAKSALLILGGGPLMNVCVLFYVCDRKFPGDIFTSKPPQWRDENLSVCVAGTICHSGL